MNQDNETVITSKMREHLSRLGLAKGFEDVPDFLTAKAKQLLADKEIADMDAEMKERLADLEAKLPRLK